MFLRPQNEFSHFPTLIIYKAGQKFKAIGNKINQFKTVKKLQFKNNFLGDSASRNYSVVNWLAELTICTHILVLISLGTH